MYGHEPLCHYHLLGYHRACAGQAHSEQDNLQQLHLVHLQDDFWVHLTVGESFERCRKIGGARSSLMLLRHDGHDNIRPYSVCMHALCIANVEGDECKLSVIIYLFLWAIREGHAPERHNSQSSSWFIAEVVLLMAKY